MDDAVLDVVRLCFRIVAVVGLLALLQHYVLYPLSLSLLSRLVRRPVVKDPDYTTAITVIIAAYNEERYIEGAVRSVIAQHYPSHLLTVLVGSDGSTDATETIVERLASQDPRITLVRFPRSGKNKVVRALSQAASTEILVFMDADCRLPQGSLRKLIANMADPSVGGVIGRQVYGAEQHQDDVTVQSEKFYHMVEEQMRKSESLISSTVAAMGALYAIRRSYFTEFPNDNVCDDFYPLLKAVLAGKRVVIEENAIVFETRLNTLEQEFRRVERFTACGVSSVRAARGLLSPAFGFYAYFLWSHKVLRWYSPFFVVMLALGVVGEGVLSGQYWMLFGILIFFMLAFVGSRKDLSISQPIVFRLPYIFLRVNLAMIKGINAASGSDRLSRWEAAP